MNLRRVAILFGRELRASAGNFLMIFAVVVPIVFTLLINLVFGDVFSGRPVMGFYDPHQSQFTRMLMAQGQLKTSSYDSLDRMIADVASGRLETGYVVPEGFDQILKEGVETDFLVYTWGETPLKDRLIADSTIANIINEIAGLGRNVTVNVQVLGQAEQNSLADRLMPMLVLMTIMLGGVLVPALSMIGEKQSHTLQALNVTPVRLGEILAAKTLLGLTLGTATAVITLYLNRAFGSDPLLLIFVLLLSALTASLFGTLLGALLRDMNTLLAALKAGGLLLMAPAILEMVPKAPDWIARIFPTYYILNPVMEVAERGAGLDAILGNLLVLAAIAGLLVFGLALVIERQQKRLALF